MVAANVDGANVPAVPEGVGPLHQPPTFNEGTVIYNIWLLSIKYRNKKRGYGEMEKKGK